MENEKNTPSAAVQNVAELKRLVIANAVATGYTFAFHDLFSRLAEVSDKGDDAGVGPEILGHIGYLLPSDEAAASPEFAAAMELVEQLEPRDDAVPAALLEQTARQAVALGKFAYAEDAYKLLGIKKEMVGLYAQSGEQLLREDKPKHAAMAFFVAASIEDPIGPHYQYLGFELHTECPAEPEKCVTALPIELLVDAAIRVLLTNEPLAERLIASARPEQKGYILATLAACRDLDLPGLVENLRAASAELSRIDDGKPDDYSRIGPMLLGRQTASEQAWQYLREFCFEHPLGSLCVCVKIIKNTPVLVPVIRDGKPLIDLLLPPEFLKT